MSKGLPKRSNDYSLWYNELIKKAALAENSPIRGCMVIRPYGFAIWEMMQAALDGMFKKTGHSNVYFPLFIPKSYLNKEAAHVEGFAKECAVVTHYRLKTSDDQSGLEVDPDAKLEEELIVRPTSETVIWNTYRNWIQSYRDLPLLLNQWANVVRWEMRTRLFLRTSEFLWQEGHTAHATEQEALEETRKMLQVYTDFVQDYMAVPVIQGVKTESERFAGAVDTYCIESLMQDGKALQSGTSHFLGQNFSKAFDVKYATQDGQLEYVWGTSWGVSTRLMGALIMVHGDDRGLVLPPKLAPVQVVIVPIYKDSAELEALTDVVQRITYQLKELDISVKYDSSDHQKPGWKFAEHELKGIPVRLALGPRDLKNDTVEVFRRDTREKETLPAASIGLAVQQLLSDIQKNLYRKALDFRDNHITKVSSYEEFKKVLEEKGGFIRAHWDGTAETEQRIKEETKATIRCIPIKEEAVPGVCIYSGNPSEREVLFAKAY